MATRAATAYHDRKSREDIADKDRRQQKQLKNKELDIRDKEVNYKGIKYSAGATKDIVSAASGLAAMNHPQWYKNLANADVVAKLPYWYRAGEVLFSGWYDDLQDRVPGIAVIWYQSSLPNYYKVNVSGSNYWKDSPINLTLTRFMSEVRKHNSRIGEYDAYDFGLYWYASADLMDHILKLGKAIKVYNTYYADNAYYAKALIHAIGFDPTDFFSHIAEYKIFYNKIVNIFNDSIVIPRAITFMQRRAWMASTIVRDRKSNKAQVYIFRQYSSGSLNESETSVVFTASTSDATFTVFENNINGKLNNLINSTGIVTMTADLRAAFEPSELLVLPLLKGDEKVEYSESEYDLEQVHNLKCLPVIGGNAPTLTRMSIGADAASGCLFQGTISGGTVTPMCAKYGTALNTVPDPSVSASKANQWMNFYDETRSDDTDSVLEATRLRITLFTTAFPGKDKEYLIQYCGTEIPLYITLIRLTNNPGVYNEVVVSTDITEADLSATNMMQIGFSSAFDWFPIIRYTDSGAVDGFLTVGEIDHPVIISNENLAKLHEFCAFSEFTIVK